jgi:hypothetical protein
MSFGVSQTLGPTGDNKRKCTSRPIVRCRPEASLVSLNNGFAHGEPDSHSVDLGRVERLEDPFRSLRRNTDARIFHAEPDLILPVRLSSDDQLSWAIVNCSHCIGTVSKQVQDDLLKLDPVSDNRREVIRKLMQEDHAASLEVTQR